jgi:hypothetical protein
MVEPSIVGQDSDLDANLSGLESSTKSYKTKRRQPFSAEIVTRKTECPDC